VCSGALIAEELGKEGRLKWLTDLRKGVAGYGHPQKLLIFF
jgi:hypothetical protein